MTPALSVLNATRLTAIIQQLQDQREIPQPLRLLDRTPVVAAEDGDIIGRMINRVQIADIIADDQKAATYSASKITYEATAIPNLKHGINYTQSMLNQLKRVSLSSVVGSMYEASERNDVAAVLLGVRQRMEALIVAMWTDNLVYDRFGIRISGSFGMPSDLKATTTVPWTDAANATPVNDIWGMRLVGSERYGIDYDRVTMRTAVFRLMIATTEFQNKARTFLAPNVSYVNLTLTDLDAQRAIAQNVLGMELELYDGRYWSQAGNGSLASAAFWPINNVVLSSKANDNNMDAMDFANAVTTESIVSELVGTTVVGNIPQIAGPVSYATATSVDLNSPGVTIWGVARGFPRKKLLQATARLNVGTITDPIAVGEPF